MLDAPRRTDVLVAAEDDERFESVLTGAIRIREAVLRRVLAREEGDDVRSRHVAAKVDDEMPEVVLFLHPDGAVGEEHERAVARQPAHGVVRVDPGVHARCRLELGTRRTQLGRDDARVPFQPFDQYAQSIPVTVNPLY